MAKSGNYELAIKIAGKVDPSLKAATKAASGEFSKMQSVAKTAMKGVAVGAAAAATALVAIGTAAVNGNRRRTRRSERCDGDCLHQ